MAAKKPEKEAVSHLNAMIDSDLHRRLTILKANSGKTIQELVEEAVRLLLERKEKDFKH